MDKNIDQSIVNDNSISQINILHKDDQILDQTQRPSEVQSSNDASMADGDTGFEKSNLIGIKEKMRS